MERHIINWLSMTLWICGFVFYWKTNYDNRSDNVIPDTFFCSHSYHDVWRRIIHIPIAFLSCGVTSAFQRNDNHPHVYGSESDLVHLSWAPLDVLVQENPGAIIEVIQPAWVYSEMQSFRINIVIKITPSGDSASWRYVCRVHAARVHLASCPCLNEFELKHVPITKDAWNMYSPYSISGSDIFFFLFLEPRLSGEINSSWKSGMTVDWVFLSLGLHKTLILRMILWYQWVPLVMKERKKLVNSWSTWISATNKCNHLRRIRMRYSTAIQCLE